MEALGTCNACIGGPCRDCARIILMNVFLKSGALKLAQACPDHDIGYHSYFYRLGYRDRMF